MGVSFWYCTVSIWPSAALDHQIGVHLGDLFGDQAVIERLRTVGVRLPIAVGDRPQSEQTAAGVTHILYVFLEPARGRDDTELPA